MHKHLYSILTDYGLSYKESKIYIALLQLGKARAATIASRTQIKRVTVYAVLQNMTEKHIVTVYQDKGVNIYSVISPQQLLLRKERQLSSFERSLPALVDIVDTWGKRPQLSYYDGINQLCGLYDMIATHTGTIMAFCHLHDIHPRVYSYLLDTRIPLLGNSHNESRLLVDKDTINDEFCTTCMQQLQLSQRRVDSGQLFGIAGDIVLFGTDRIAFILFEKDDLVGYVIQNKSLYQTLASMFERARRVSEK